MSDEVFDGFFYTEDRSQPGTIIGLPLNERQSTVFAAVVAGYPLESVDGETYWRSCYKFLMYDAPQGYLAWRGRSYWMVALPRVDDHGHFDRSASGLHVIEFTPDHIRHAWVEATSFDEPTTAQACVGELQIHDSGMMRAIEAMRVFGRSDEADDEEADDDDSIEITLPDALSELVVTPWYWSRSETSAEGQRKLVTEELAVLRANVGWTDALHREMAEKFPF